VIVPSGAPGSAEREQTVMLAAGQPTTKPAGAPTEGAGQAAGRRAAASPGTPGSAATQRPSGKAPARPSGRRRSHLRWPWRVALSLLVLAGVAAGGYAVVASRLPTGSTVHDRSGRITVTVPAAWGRQLQDDGWSPKAAGLGPEAGAAALAISADLARWRDPATGTPGVFVGMSGDRALVQKVGQIAHPGCRKTSQAYRRSGFTGTVFRHACPGAASFAEVGLTERGAPTGVYVQVKQPTVEDRTAQILDSLRVGRP
jgi:hypothetical protein